MSKPLSLIFLALLASACQHAGPDAATSDAAAGQAFAQRSCGGCHAVERHGVSQNRNAPPFAAIVNRPGLSAETLTVWLRDAHNYPEEMRFRLGPGEVDRLVAYMLTLHDPDYRPPVQ